MIVHEAGHIYVLPSLDGNMPQILTFVKRIGAHFPGNTGAPHPGTTTQEVVRALLDRSRYVNKQIPCVETEAVIAALQSILLLLEVRAKRVKGKHLREGTLAEIEAAKVCNICGHVSCLEVEHA